MRAYSQLGIMLEDSEEIGCPTGPQLARANAIADPNARRAKLASLNTTCPPEYSAGDLGQHRNFYNPEFDANLTDFMKWAYADEFKFRFAWWGFYDGLYDYLDGEWNNHRRAATTRFAQSDNIEGESFFFNDENKDPRGIYAHRNRINELYVDYTHGPFFLRVGRQAISWGESDTIALLDVSNPFDLTLGAPGFFQDVEEARIPLWTVRSTMKIADSLGPVSSLFADVYMVPGPIDTTVSINPITAGVSPFNPDVADPNLNLIAQGQSAALHTVLVDRLPEKKWTNTRWGARLTGVLLRDYTVQGWFFRTFNQQPTPYITNASAFKLAQDGKTTLVDDRGFRVSECTNGRTPAGRACGKKAPVVTILDRRLESVIGLAATWFSQPVNGILKWEIEYFIDEMAIIPTQNLNARVQIPKALRAPGEVVKNTIPTADYVRWVIGYDRNFFLRALNPTNSFILVASYNSSFNLSEKGGMDFRNGQAKPGHPQARNGPIKGNPICQGQQAFTNALCVHVDPHDYEDAYQYEGFLQMTVRSDYLHGKLQPQLTTIADVSGMFAVNPSVSYRIFDDALASVFVSANYLMIQTTGRKAGLGTFRAHDMMQLRVTAQLN